MKIPNATAWANAQIGALSEEVDAKIEMYSKRILEATSAPIYVYGHVDDSRVRERVEKALEAEGWVVQWQRAGENNDTDAACLIISPSKTYY